MNTTICENNTVQFTLFLVMRSVIIIIANGAIVIHAPCLSLKMGWRDTSETLLNKIKYNINYKKK